MHRLLFGLQHRCIAYFLVEMQAEQILTGSRAVVYEKVGAESRADTKLLQFFAFFAVFMPFLYRYWNKRAVIVDQRAEQTSLIWGDFWAGLALSALLATERNGPGSGMDPFFCPLLLFLGWKTQNIPSLRRNISSNAQYIKKL